MVPMWNLLPNLFPLIIKSKKLTSETPFTFSNSDAVVTGDQLEADTVLNKVMAKGHAKLVKK